MRGTPQIHRHFVVDTCFEDFCVIYFDLTNYFTMAVLDNGHWSVVIFGNLLLYYVVFRPVSWYLIDILASCVLGNKLSVLVS
jgi:hypothetical protein